jgi:hypothetical protein
LQIGGGAGGEAGIKIKGWKRNIYWTLLQGDILLGAKLKNGLENYSGLGNSEALLQKNAT